MSARIDWEVAERSPEFRELVQRKRSFVIPALGFSMLWYFGFIALAGYAPDFMGEKIVKDLTVGYALALSQFVMVWGLSWAYIRKGERDFDPLAERAARRALEVSDAARGDGDGRAATGRFTRDEATAPAATEEVTRR